jgi:hypothetical protein
VGLANSSSRVEELALVKPTAGQGIATSLVKLDDLFAHHLENCLVCLNGYRLESRTRGGSPGQSGPDRTMVSGIEAQIKVTTAGAAFWAGLLLWGRANRKLSEREAKTLEICSSYPRKIPTEFQCQQAVSVLERLTEEGFVERSA